MAMQTRDEFIANFGRAKISSLLRRAIDSNDIHELNCNICSETLTHPVELPCKHVFDLDCISKWLSMSHRNTCPMCRVVLFALPESEQLGPGRDRAGVVRTAVRESLLPPYTTQGIDHFGIPCVSNPALLRATASATDWLIFSYTAQPVNIARPFVVRTQVLAAHVVAMATIIPAVAHVEANALGNPEQTADWRLLVQSVWKVLVHRDGRAIDATVMPSQLLTELRAEIAAHEPRVDGLTLFVGAEGSEDGARSEVTDLLRYIVHVSVRDAAERQVEKDRADRRRKETREKRKAAREEPKMTSRCGIM